MKTVHALKRFVPLVGLVFAAGCGYNTIQTYDEQVNAAAAQIKVQLQRRADLIPNLVETVKGYAKQEQTVFTEVAEARARLSLARASATSVKTVCSCFAYPFTVSTRLGMRSARRCSCTLICAAAAFTCSS